MKNDRLFQILYILLEKQSITAPELADLLEVSVRTVYRDVDSLSAAGVPIQTLAGKGGGISLMPGFSLQKALLSKDEQDQLILGLQTISGLQPGSRDLRALRDKLQGLFRRDTLSADDWIRVDLARWGHGQKDSDKFDLLKNAIQKKQILRILYYGSSGKATEREISPIKLVFKSKTWYLQAFCNTAGDYRLFRLPRISNTALTGATHNMDFSDMPPIDAPGPMPPPEAALVLRFSPSVTYRLFDEFEAEDMEPQPDGSTVIRTFFPIDSWVYGYLLGFGTAVEVLSPLSLRQDLAEQAKKIYAHHNT